MEEGAEDWEEVGEGEGAWLGGVGWEEVVGCLEAE